MPKYGSHLQRDAYDLFKKQDIDMAEWAKCTFERTRDDNNDECIMGKEVVEKMEELKEKFEYMVEECEEYDKEDGKTYMIFEMSEYVIGPTDYEHVEDRNWVYQYEIYEYYDLIVGKLDEYYILVKEIEEEKAKIQMVKDVCVGVTIALMLR